MKNGFRLSAKASQIFQGILGVALSCTTAPLKFGRGSGGMSAKWGSVTKRTEAEAIIIAIKGVLNAHVIAHPKDVVWRRQLERVEAQLATGKL